MFMAVLGQMEDAGRAPLEWPIGPIDLVGEYCALFLSGEGRFVSVESVLEDWPGAYEVVDPTSAALLGEHKGRVVTAAKVLLRPDGAIQVWPSHQFIPFVVGATVAVDLARFLRDRHDLPGRLGADPLSAAHWDELPQRARGLGVDFYEWAQGLGTP